MARCDRRAMKPARLMAGIYRGHPAPAGAARLGPRRGKRVQAAEMGEALDRAASYGSGSAPVGQVHVVGAGPRRALGRPSCWPRPAARSRSTKPGPPPAAAAARISTANSAAGSTTATTCCCPATSAAMAYLDTHRRPRHLAGPARRASRSSICATGERWEVRPNRGAMPWWMLAPRRRVPGTRLRDYLALLALRRAGADDDGGGGAGAAGRSTRGCWSRWRSRR